MAKKEYHNREDQIHDKYWNYTAAFTDLYDKLFIGVLACCVEYIEGHPGEYSSEKFMELQQILQSRYPMTGNDPYASQRKRINQLVKIGAIQPFLAGFHPEIKEFIETSSTKKRKSIISKVIYTNANIASSTTKAYEGRHLNFFLKTLDELGSISEIDLATIMTIDIASFGKDHASKEDLEKQRMAVDIKEFFSRKYNQVSHFRSLLNQLEDVVDHKGVIYYKTDADALFGGGPAAGREVRDPYLQRVFKSELEEESCIHYEAEVPKCMLEGIAHPVMIASHIKPYSHCPEAEQFDVNNGLLLSRNLDSLFDLGYITFNDDGTIRPCADLSKDADMVNYLNQYRLHNDFINPKRMEYMQYHRDVVFEKRYGSALAKRYLL